MDIQVTHSITVTSISFFFSKKNFILEKETEEIQDTSLQHEHEEIT
jgi:hypothetical protein